MPDISVRGLASAARAIALAVVGALLVLLVVIERDGWKQEVEYLARGEGTRHARDSFRRGDDRLIEVVPQGRASQETGKTHIVLRELPRRHVIPLDLIFNGAQIFAFECYVDAYNETMRELKSSPHDEAPIQPRETESAT